MTHPRKPAGLARPLIHAALAAALVLTAACGAAGGRDEYAEDGDTGAAAPATEGGYDASTAKMIGPDSGPGMNARTGQPGVAGDTMGSRGMPAGRTDSATRSGIPPR